MPCATTIEARLAPPHCPESRRAYSALISEAFIVHYNRQRYHESLRNLTPADVYFGRGQTILLDRERIKRQMIQQRRLIHHQQAA